MKKRILFSLLSIIISTAAAQERISDIVTYQLPVKKLKLNSEEIAYSETGKGETTLLFVHGLSSTMDSWQKNISELKDQYHTIAVDLPGYGKSSKNKTDYSLKEYAMMLNDFIQKKELENVVLVGHSMGGQISIHTVLNYPQNFEKLVLIAPAGIETFSEKEAAIMKSAYTPAMVESTSDEQILANYKLNFYSFPEDALKMVDQRIAMKKAEDFPQYAETVVNNIHAMLDEPVIDRLSELDLPVLMIFGKNDMLIPNRYFHPEESIDNLLKVSKDRIKDLKVETIDEAGHFVNFEKCDQVNEAIRNFIN